MKFRSTTPYEIARGDFVCIHDQGRNVHAVVEGVVLDPRTGRYHLTLKGGTHYEAAPNDTSILRFC